MKPSRRSFVAALGAAVLFASGCSTSSSVGTGSSFKGPVGLQLYSLRGLFTKSVPQGLDLTKSYGIRDVELAGTYGMPPEKLKAMLDERGLNPVAGHFSFEKLRDDPESVAKEAKALGLKYAGSAWIPHQGAFDEPQAKAAAAALNRAGEVFAKHGLKVYYHCHGFEFQPGVIPGGRKAMEILLAETDPKLVAFQMDILWITFPGEDAAEWLTKYPGRWVSLHLKDLKKGVKTGFHNGGTDPNNDVVLGTGQMNWPKILAAAKQSGVKYYFIEDESANAAEQIPQTLKFLETVKF